MRNPYAPPTPSEQAEATSEGRATRGVEREQDRRRPSTPGPGRVEQPRRRPSPEEVRRTSRHVFRAAACALGALVTTALPLPWPALGLLLSLAALVLGVRALLAVRAANLTRSFLPVVAVTLVIGLLYLVSSLGVVVSWPLQQERQDCLARALTVSARDACEDEFREGLNRFRPDVA